MTATMTMTSSAERALVRGATYEFLALAFRYPEDGLVAALREGASTLAESAERLGLPGLDATLIELSRELDAVDDVALEDAFIKVFGHTPSSSCSPYEGEYGQAHIFQKSETLADLSAFYRTFGVMLSPDWKERLDHISVELEFMHLLALRETWALSEQDNEALGAHIQGQRVFLSRHLAHWIIAFAGSMGRQAAQVGVYRALAQVLEAHMSAEFAAFGITPITRRARAVPLAAEMEPEDGCPATWAGA